MVIRGSLRDGKIVCAQFYCREDLRESRYNEENEPVAWLEVGFSESEARSFLHWLRSPRAAEYSSPGLTARAGEGFVIIEARANLKITIRLGEPNLVESLQKCIGSTLALILGHAVDDQEN